MPTVVVVAPRRNTARLTLRMAREMIRTVPALERRIIKGEDTKDGFALKRPDGRTVGMMAIAAARGGITGRGFSTLGRIFDESEFFASGSEFVVTDADVFGGLVPRALAGSPTIFISTPWPSPSLTSELFGKNYGAPNDALCAAGSTIFMRPDRPDLVARIDAEMARDAETTQREFFVSRDAVGGENFFDKDTVAACVDHELALSNVPPAQTETFYGAWDLGLVRDASALAVCGRNASGLVTLRQMHELRPTKGSPLRLSRVISEFGDILRGFRINAVHGDGHAREPAREYADPLGINIESAPEGRDGKFATYEITRRLARDGMLRIPAHDRLLAMMRNVVAKPMPGGSYAVSSPRRAGLHHADLVSAVVLSAWAAAGSGAPDYSALVKKFPNGF
jgi:hypothetical protein